MLGFSTMTGIIFTSPT